MTLYRSRLSRAGARYEPLAARRGRLIVQRPVARPAAAGKLARAMAGVSSTRIALGALAAVAALLALPGASWAADLALLPRRHRRAVRDAEGPARPHGRDPRQRAAEAGAAALRRRPGRRSCTSPAVPAAPGSRRCSAVMPLVPSLLDSYRVVGFDQRGTGGSGLLRCPALERDPRLRSVRAGAACAERLGEKRRLYTTPDSVADLEAIRAELGVERLTLFGISYGTELALAYARAHPDHVDRLILDSVVDPDDRDPFGLAGFRAMGPSLAGLCPARCRGVTRDPLGLVAKLAARLRDRGTSGVAYDRRGRRHRRADRPDRDLRPAVRLRLQPAAAGRDARGRARRAARRHGAARAPARRGRRAGRAAVAEVVLQRPLRGGLRGDAAAVGRLDAARRPAGRGAAARGRDRPARRSTPST